MKVLVCGGTGWVGHHIVEALLAEGHEPTVLCRGRDKRFSAPGGVQIINADKNDRQALASAAGDVEFEAVVDSVPTPASVENCVHLFNGRIRHYVQCSSTGVYVPLQRTPANEEHAWREPTGVNFMNKVKVDLLALRHHEESGFPATIVRPTNIIGAGLIPIDVWGARRAGFWRRLNASLPIAIPDHGSALLQPCHVKDVAKPFALALGRDEAAGRIYNVSAAYSITLDRYVEVCRDILGSKSRLSHVPADTLVELHEGTGLVSASGLRFLCLHMCFDIARVRTLGYSPSFTPEEGVEDAIRWMRDEGIIEAGAE